MKNKSGYKQLQDYIMKKIDHMSGKSEFIIITLFSLVLVFGVTGMMGTLTSGYHLVDDHQFLKYFYEMKDQGTNVFQIIVSTVQMDFVARCRPLYYITRVFSVYFLGIDLVALSVMKAMEIVASIILLYYCGKRMGANKICSFLFSLPSMVGYQSVTW